MVPPMARSTVEDSLIGKLHFFSYCPSRSFFKDYALPIDARKIVRTYKRIGDCSKKIVSVFHRAVFTVCLHD